MNKEILLIIALTSLLWIVILMFIYVNNKNRIEKNLIQKNDDLRKSYDKGYTDSESKKELSVQIIPWKEEVDSSTLFKNKKTIKVGYKHQLFSNGMPCFEPNITIVEELIVDKLNEENIKKAFSNLELIMNNIPNTGNVAVKVIGNGKDLANSLLNLTKKKK